MFLSKRHFFHGKNHWTSIIATFLLTKPPPPPQNRPFALGGIEKIKQKQNHSNIPVKMSMSIWMERRTNDGEKKKCTTKAKNCCQTAAVAKHQHQHHHFWVSACEEP